MEHVHHIMKSTFKIYLILCSNLNCLKKSDVDYKGLDLTYSFASSPQGCCGICLNTKGCNAFTYVNYFQICWLKNISSIIGARTCSKGRVSSLINPLMTSSTLP